MIGPTQLPDLPSDTDLIGFALFVSFQIHHSGTCLAQMSEHRIVLSTRLEHYLTMFPGKRFGLNHNEGLSASAYGIWLFRLANCYLLD